MEKKYLTEKECDQLGLPWSRTTRWRARIEGRLGYLRVNNRVCYAQEHIDAYLRNCERPARQSNAS